MFPQLKVTIVDSLNKRIQFLNHLASELHLEDVSFIHDRAETLAKVSIGSLMTLLLQEL